MALTDRAIVHAKPCGKPYKLSDSHGLYLLVNPNGSKRWYIKYRFVNKEKKLALGPYPLLTLAQARRMREEAQLLLISGIDPSAHRKAERLAITPEHTFESVAREWVTSNVNWSAEHKKRVLRYFELYVFPTNGSCDITKMKVKDLLVPIKEVEKAGKLDVASRLQQRTACVMRYAVQNGIIDHNPASDLTGAVSTPKVRHHPALDLNLIPDFLERIDDYKGRQLTQLAVKLALLLFIRSSELRFARWDEIDLHNAMWTIPAEREPIPGVKYSARGAKMHSPHLVPLSRQAIELLHEVQQHCRPGTELVFPGDHNYRKPMSENTINKALRVMGYDTQKDVCGHGFRTMACSALVESGLWSSDAVERQMSHQERKRVRAAYIHKAQHLEERREMMQWWADYLDANRFRHVVPYGFKKSPGGALDHMSFQERNDRQLEELKARILSDSDWLTASELSAKAGFRSADPEVGPKGWKAAGKIFSLKVDGEDLYPDYALDEKMRPLKVVRLILSLFKERKTPWGLAIWFGSANRRLRGGKPKDLLISKSELVLMAAQDEVESWASSKRFI
ncbi:integrase arm-type DNA-binding domain-containing protein [Klebsiella pneumoniae]|nr:integrase arm-type DNA-binding domain-containing protein [Klebsiella pneumoniae]EJM8714590.1 integrase arm-type DNA-binding domain-containing protein [Klebsiella pneumoniae]MBC4131338.1 integrase arm-type DNA-binding domain-containing protein [Klebsiella pneumoniae]MCY0472659.1 integrase arm-type DNA-binding domain-containing protein [Klebsiella pneumoniae]MDH8514805.1 integrase arm-type DNA-binding domain-containing protein [Klebsiella pneumoniae]MDH8590726.1 integrase arm-type DNA-binding